MIGEANFSDHGANRLGASALMQGLADGYFVLPNTIGDYLASNKFEKVDAHARRGARGRSQRRMRSPSKLLEIKGTRSVDSYHRELGKIMWEYCGMARNADGLEAGARARFPRCASSSGSDVKVLGTGEELNQSLEKAGRVADFFELAELMCLRRAGAQRILRRPLPRGVSDARRRGGARRRALLVRRRLGLPGRGQAARAAQGAADFRIRAPLATELQVMRIILHIWRQRNASDKGQMVRYEVPNVNHEMSFLEMLDVLNEDLIAKGEEPVAFDHDCREGICGMCGCMVNGVAHGPLPGTTLCQLHMRHFKDGDELYLEPWRATRFPGGQGPGGGPQRVRPHHRRRRLYLRLHRQRAGWQRRSWCRRRMPNAPWTRRPASAAAPAWPCAPTPRRRCSPAPRSRTSGCCRKASRSASSAPSRWWRRPTQELFGSCTNIGECEAVCPKEIKLEVIARMNRDFLGAKWAGRAGLQDD